MIIFIHQSSCFIVILLSPLMSLGLTLGAYMGKEDIFTT